MMIKQWKANNPHNREAGNIIVRQLGWKISLKNQLMD